MWKAIKLILIYFVMQILGTLTATPIATLYVYFTTGGFDTYQSSQLAAIPAMILGFAYMALYLWKKNYLTGDSALYDPTSARVLGWSVLGGVSVMWLGEFVTSSLAFLPDWMEATFTNMSGSVMGFISLAVLGPVLEELLFRGAVTKELLKRYKPGTAIVLSGLLFGLFHINPAQVVGAMISGFFFAWLYYRTRSLVPGIVLHILNNGLAAWLMAAHPEWNDLSFRQLLNSDALYFALLAVAAVALLLSLRMLRRCTYVSPAAPAAEAEVTNNNP